MTIPQDKVRKLVPPCMVVHELLHTGQNLVTDGVKIDLCLDQHGGHLVILPRQKLKLPIKEYHPRTGELIVSAKETEVNPFFGAEERHPVGSRRFAMISGKYGGGVFCNLPDGVTCMCNYSYQHEDADFMVGEHVMLMVQRYDQEKLQMYGKIMSKW